MHGEFWFVIILKVSAVLSESYVKGLASLSNKFHVTVRACELVDCNFFQLFVCFCMGWFLVENSNDGIISGIWNFDWEILEQLSDKLSLFSHISEFCLLVCAFFCCFSVCSVLLMLFTVEASYLLLYIICLNDVIFLFIIGLAQLIANHSIIHAMYCGVFVLRWMTGAVRYYGICSGWLSVYTEGMVFCAFHFWCCALLLSHCVMLYCCCESSSSSSSMRTHQQSGAIRLNTRITIRNIGKETHTWVQTFNYHSAGTHRTVLPNHMHQHTSFFWREKTNKMQQLDVYY